MSRTVMLSALTVMKEEMVPLSESQPFATKGVH